MNKKFIKLGALINASGAHPAGWISERTPKSADTNIEHYRSLIETAESGKLDLFFMADVPAMQTGPEEIVSKWPHYTNVFEPLTALSALSSWTKNIGLGATISTSFDQPYTIARQLASLDKLSGGRVAWNVVTTALPSTATNYGLKELPDSKDRYQKATEAVELVQRYWNTWSDNAFTENKLNSQYYDPAELNSVDFEGEYFNVSGAALNIGRSPQGQPVIMQAGASEEGRNLAALKGEIIFAVGKTPQEVKSFVDDIRRRAKEFGRNPESVNILAGISLVSGATREEANAKYDALKAQINREVALYRISKDLEADLSGLDWEKPIPVERIPEKSSYFTAFKKDLTAQVLEGKTLGEIAMNYERGQGVWADSGFNIANKMKQWTEISGIDGFIITFQSMPEGLEDLVKFVVPELQKLGLFRTDYKFSTLRENLME